MAGAYVVFHHYQFLWVVSLGMVVVFNDPCLDEVTRSRTFAVQVASFMSNCKTFVCCSKHSGLLWDPPSLIFSRYQGCVHW